MTGKRSWEAPSFEQNELTHSRPRFERMIAQSTESPETQVGGPSHEWLYEALDAAETARRKAAKIRVPVLLLQAGADTIVEAQGQDEFCRNLNAARPGACRLLRIENARHELFIESDEYRDPALTAVLEFFQELR